MTSFHEELQKAERLDLIARKVGFALWQLQELEGGAAQYLVLVAKAKPGMGLAAGEALVEEAQSKTFGRTISDLLKTSQLSRAVELRFKALLVERNWLVHQSRSTSRDAVHHDHACARLVARLEGIAEEARVLLHEVVLHAEVFVRKHGITAEQVEKVVAQTLKSWQGGGAL
jgi:hypothetical protein